MYLVITVNGTHIECCSRDAKYLPAAQTHPLCLPVDVAANDPFYSQFGVRCHSFVRSVVAPREDCKLGFANQVCNLLVDPSTNLQPISRPIYLSIPYQLTCLLTRNLLVDLSSYQFLISRNIYS